MTTVTTVNNHPLLFDFSPTSFCVSASIWVPVGTRDEDSLHKGAAHALEHIISATRIEGSSFVEEVDRLGGQLNVVTTPEHTIYGFTVPCTEWEKPWRLLLEQFSDPDFSPHLLDEQRNILLREYNSSMTNVKHEAFRMNMVDAFGGNSLAEPVIGEEQLVKRITLRDIKDFYNEEYRQSNYFYVISGNVNNSYAAEITSSYSDNNRFLQINTSKQRIRRTSPHLRCAINRHTYMSQQSHVALTWMTSRTDDLATSVTSVLNRYIGGQLNAWLPNALSMNPSFNSYSAYSYRTNFSDCTLWHLYISSPQFFTEEMINLLEHCAKDGIVNLLNQNEMLLDTIKGLIGSLSLGLEATSMRVNWIGRHWIRRRKLPSFSAQCTIYSGVNAENLAEIANSFVGPAVSVLEQTYDTKK